MTVDDTANHCDTIKWGHTTTEGGDETGASPEEDLDVFSLPEDILQFMHRFAVLK